MRDRWEFFIQLDSKSMNARLTNSGNTRWAYKAERNRWEAMLEATLADLSSGVASATSKRRVTITRCYFGRQQHRDHDNLVGGCKAMVDALVRTGVLVDDNAKGAQIFYRQERATPTGVRFLVEEFAIELHTQMADGSLVTRVL